MLLVDFILPDGPDWRWQSASALYKTNSRLSRRHDRWVKAAVAYLRQGAPEGAIHEARGLHLGTAHIRNRIEAVLMCADLTIEQMAEYLGIPVPTLEAFEALFFSVFPYHGRPGALISRTVTPAECMEPWDMTRPAFQKFLAACNGFRLLRPVLEPDCMTPEVREELEGIKGAQEARDWSLRQWSRPVNPTNIGAITEEVLQGMQEEPLEATPMTGDILDLLRTIMVEKSMTCAPELKPLATEVLRKIEALRVAV